MSTLVGEMNAVFGAGLLIMLICNYQYNHSQADAYAKMRINIITYGYAITYGGFVAVCLYLMMKYNL